MLADADSEQQNLAKRLWLKSLGRGWDRRVRRELRTEPASFLTRDMETRVG